MWKKLRVWKSEAQNGVGIFWQNLIFWAETFFQRPLKHFLWTLWTCWRYLQGPLDIADYDGKRVRSISCVNTSPKIVKSWKTPIDQTCCKRLNSRLLTFHSLQKIESVFFALALVWKKKLKKYKDRIFIKNSNSRKKSIDSWM